MRPLAPQIPCGRRLDAIIDATGADELIVTSQIFDHQARLRSYEILAQVRDALAS